MYKQTHATTMVLPSDVSIYSSGSITTVLNDDDDHWQYSFSIQLQGDTRYDVFVI